MKEQHYDRQANSMYELSVEFYWFDLVSVGGKQKL